MFKAISQKRYKRLCRKRSRNNVQNKGRFHANKTPGIVNTTTVVYLSVEHYRSVAK